MLSTGKMIRYNNIVYITLTITVYCIINEYYNIMQPYEKEDNLYQSIYITD